MSQLMVRSYSFLLLMMLLSAVLMMFISAASPMNAQSTRASNVLSLLNEKKEQLEKVNNGLSETSLLMIASKREQSSPLYTAYSEEKNRIYNFNFLQKLYNSSINESTTSTTSEADLKKQMKLEQEAAAVKKVEQERKLKEEQEKKIKEEQEKKLKLEQEATVVAAKKAEQEKKIKEEQERKLKAAEEEERKLKEEAAKKAEQEKKLKEEQEKKLKLEQEAAAVKKAEQERIQKEEQARKALELERKAEQERKAKEEKRIQEERDRLIPTIGELVDSDLLTPSQSERFMKEIMKGVNQQLPHRIWKAKKHGSSIANFHATCDNMGPTIVLAKTRNGAVFGAYSKISYSLSGDYVSDPAAFMFSLISAEGEQRFVKLTQTPQIVDGKQTYPTSKIHNANHLITFGGGYDLLISDNTVSLSSSLVCHTYCAPQVTNPKTYLAGERTFMIDDFEVYRV
ncbi:predicted protein [Naegleria gruberi]|uniref:Oxidation resistance protein 1 n=1 Tax=Naegleria gruberi TaxID=5762 RepID=D2V5F1_NAEGR|nr:uncharacterized protein NAEGRDRAFT_63800 [Naegleria gruberi]EFC47939.1 predicted protein [Naegleria gruberi]|eukprot:XP_002680683.1 predicted protein [Naegleria gruberi strain NEG-M]